MFKFGEEIEYLHAYFFKYEIVPFWLNAGGRKQIFDGFNQRRKKQITNPNIKVSNVPHTIWS